MTEDINMLNKAGILIIDDDPNLRKSLSDILSAKGYEILTAKDGTEGLAMIKHCSFEVSYLSTWGFPIFQGSKC